MTEVAKSRKLLRPLSIARRLRQMEDRFGRPALSHKRSSEAFDLYCKAYAIEEQMAEQIELDWLDARFHASRNVRNRRRASVE